MRSLHFGRGAWVCNPELVEWIQDLDDHQKRDPSAYVRDDNAIVPTLMEGASEGLCGECLNSWQRHIVAGFVLPHTYTSCHVPNSIFVLRLVEQVFKLVWICVQVVKFALIAR